MVTVASLWLPIVLSALGVFFVSYAMWMVLPHHRGDWNGLPDEDGLVGEMRSRALTAGQYTFPYCSDPKSMADPDFVRKYEDGPSGFLIVRPSGKASMGKNMAISASFNLVVSVLVAYVATIGLSAGSPGADIFRMTATVGTLAYGAALGWGAIWFARSWSSTGREMLDGLVYGVLTGAVFLFLWPS